jgi:tetratricopeptide (TPR) repeat protein
MLLAAAFFTVFVVLTLVVWRSLARHASGPARTGKPTLAVLYFKNNTGDKDLDFLRQALVDYLIPELRGATRQITTLSEDVIRSVLSRLRLVEAGGYSTEDLQAVAAKTRAAYILTAAYFKIGDDLEIKYRLIDVEIKEPIGSGSVRGREEDYSQMAAGLIQKVLADLRLPAAAQVVQKSPAVSLAAWRFYQLGRQAERKYRDEKDRRYFDQSQDYYNQALREEPRYALAYVGLGDLHQTLYVSSQTPQDREKTLQFYEKAYQVDPESAETNAGLGWAYYLRGDNDRAFPFFKRAFELAPENPSINADIGLFFRSIGLPGQAVKFYTNAIDRGDSARPSPLSGRRSRRFTA